MPPWSSAHMMVNEVNLASGKADLGKEQGALLWNPCEGCGSDGLNV